VSSTTLLALTASIWGIAMALSPVLQIRTMLALRSSRGVSLGYLAVLNVGFCLWLAYGIELGNPALVAPNAIALVVCSTTIAVAFRLRGYPRA
jgi:uncharacterized protein with PQ loop repeat